MLEVMRRGSLVALAAAFALSAVGCASRAPAYNENTQAAAEPANNGTFVNAKERVDCKKKPARQKKKRYQKQMNEQKMEEQKASEQTTTNQKTSENEQQQNQNQQQEQRG